MATEGWQQAPIVVHEAPPPDDTFDPIYFTKGSVKLGTTITSYGRTSKGEKWTVDTIWTFRREKYGRMRSWMTEVRTNEDIIEMRNERTGERRSLKFEYLSASARYRIDEADEPPQRLNGSAPNGKAKDAEPEQAQQHE